MKGIFEAVLLSALAVSPVLAQNFFQSCDASSVVVSGKILTANCKDVFGALKCSKLDLNNCIKNVYGSLNEDPTAAGPHFGDQCFACSNDKTSSGFQIDNPTLLHCQCDPGTGAASYNWPTAVFDINTIVENVNGNLQCYGSSAKGC